MCDRMEIRGENSNVSEIVPRTADQEVRHRIQKKKIWLKNTRGKRNKVSPRKALLNFAQKIAGVAVYLAEFNQPELKEPIDCLIEIVAKIQSWLE